MKGRWIPSGVFLLLAIPGGYMTWLMWQAGDSGKWLFLVFTVFLLLMALAPFLPKGKAKPKPETFTSTRFVPHWFMMLAILVMAVSILAAIIGAILRH
jgi:bacteriorhodopsin